MQPARRFLATGLLLLALGPVGPVAQAGIIERCRELYAQALRRGDDAGKAIREVHPHLSEGRSEAYLVVFQDGSRGLFKPAQERNSVGAETGAYALDQLFGFHMVPKTEARTVKTGLLAPPRLGSMQDFVLFAEGPASPAAFTVSRTPVFRRMEFFDYVTANQDRAGNFLVKNGNYVLIDNGQSFGLHSRPLRWGRDSVEDFRLPEEELQRLSKLTKQDFLATLSPHVGPEVAAESFGRFEELMNRLGHPLRQP